MAGPTKDFVEELCEDFAKLPAGTAVKFIEGTDFTTTPATFRNKLHRLMRARGLIVVTSLKGAEVYAKITGPAPEAVEDALRRQKEKAEEAADRETIPEPAPEPARATSGRAVPDPFLPGAVAQPAASPAVNPRHRIPFALFAEPR